MINQLDLNSEKYVPFNTMSSIDNKLAIVNGASTVVRVPAETSVL